MSKQDEVLVRVDGVSKKFCRSLKRSLWYGMCDVFSEFSPFALSKHGNRPASRAGSVSHAESMGPASGLNRTRDQTDSVGKVLGANSLQPIEMAERGTALRHGEFWAVNNLSFEVKRGECLGLIGRNGAGKTTLLKMLNGLIKPDRGRIEMRGRVGGLIALGAGFNPVLTGRENVYVNGSILGLTKKQIDAKFDEIVDFAELAEFIDSPVQSYSSGMHVRLGFSVAAVLIQPDVLLLDEVLAVGDIGFTIKCLNAVRQLSARSAVVFVSHHMPHVSRFCSRALVMTRGRVIADSDPAAAINHYHNLFTLDSTVSGTGGATVSDVVLIVDGQRSTQSAEPRLQHGVEAVLHFAVHLDPSIDSAEFRVEIFDPLKLQPVISYLGYKRGEPYVMTSGSNAVALELGKLELNQGRYSFLIAVIERSTGTILHRSDGNAPFQVELDFLTWGQGVRFAPARITASKDPLLTLKRTGTAKLS